MNRAAESNSIESPVSQGRRQSRPPWLLKVLVALFGAPGAWVIQMSLSEPIAAYACYPHQAPLPAPLWVELPVILAAISLICLAAGVFSTYVAWIFWLQAGNMKISGGGSEGSQGVVLDGGQYRFLAMMGLMSSGVFVIAILFTCFAVFLVSPCSAWT